MFEITTSGSFDNSERFLKYISGGSVLQRLGNYGQQGVNALSNATPRKSGRTAGAWKYEVTKSGSVYSIVWKNTHVEDGRPIAILLQYGHGTGTGGYVEGRDYINPAIQPVMDKIASDVWKAVTSA